MLGPAPGIQRVLKNAVVKCLIVNSVFSCKQGGGSSVNVSEAYGINENTNRRTPTIIILILNCAA